MQQIRNVAEPVEVNTGRSGGTPTAKKVVVFTGNLQITIPIISALRAKLHASCTLRRVYAGVKLTTHKLT